MGESIAFAACNGKSVRFKFKKLRVKRFAEIKDERIGRLLHPCVTPESNNVTPCICSDRGYPAFLKEPSKPGAEISTMTTAEHIRWYAIKHYIAPARATGREVVRIRSGDIRQKMGLTNPLQSVRSALGTKLFQDEAGVELLDPIGPRAAADTYFHFRIRPLSSK